jgi:hypothetical protein
LISSDDNLRSSKKTTLAAQDHILQKGCARRSPTFVESSAKKPHSWMTVSQDDDGDDGFTGWSKKGDGKVRGQRINLSCT